jgi:hypothetical protein
MKLKLDADERTFQKGLPSAGIFSIKNASEIQNFAAGRGDGRIRDSRVDTRRNGGGVGRQQGGAGSSS